MRPLSRLEAVDWLQMSPAFKDPNIRAFFLANGKHGQRNRVPTEPLPGTAYLRAPDLVQAGLLHKGGKTVLSAEEPEVHAYAVISSGLCNVSRLVEYH